MAATVRVQRTREPLVVLASLGVAAACWLVSIRRMSGMDMGPATGLGSFAFFLGLWVPMMAAMMLPAALPAVSSAVRGAGRAVAAPRFVAAYLAVWTCFGAAVYLLYRTHGTTAAGVLVVAAGLYELAPLKRSCRRRCREGGRAGFTFGANCLGSSVGLMTIALALGVMSLTWMVVVAVAISLQKLVPPHPLLDGALAAAIVALGVLVVASPSSVPGLMLPM
jgi:predicted metal-binding membrane protein